MTLEETLAGMRQHSKEKFPAETREKFARGMQELRGSGIMERALKVGDAVPSFKLPNTEGVLINSDDLLKNGNLVVNFYRGVW